MCAVENWALKINIFPKREGVLEKDGSQHAAGQGGADGNANPKKAEWEQGAACPTATYESSTLQQEQ